MVMFFWQETSKSRKKTRINSKNWEIEGVEEIYNEVEIGPQNSITEKTEDFVFEAKIENRLLFEPGIFSNNYSVDVVNEMFM